MYQSQPVNRGCHVFMNTIADVDQGDKLFAITVENRQTFLYYFDVVLLYIINKGKIDGDFVNRFGSMCYGFNFIGVADDFCQVVSDSRGGCVRD